MRIKFVSIVVAFVLLIFTIKVVDRLVYLQNCNTQLMAASEESYTQYIRTKYQLERLVDELTGKLSRLSMSEPQSNPKPPGEFHKFMLVNEISFDKFYIYSEKNYENYTFIFGIPTERRKDDYLSQTLHSLLKNFTVIQTLNILIIIYVADIDIDQCSEVTHLVKTQFDQFLKAGAIEILCPHPLVYPSLDGIPLSMDESADQVKRRSKQTLDFAFLMAYASTKGEYYLHLADDVKAFDGYASEIADHVTSLQDDGWFLIHFSSLRLVGKLMRSDDLISFVQYLLLYYTNQPFDLLMEDYGKGLVCYATNVAQCSAFLDEIYLHYLPSLFRHLGSRPNSNENEDHLPKTPESFRRYFNPPAKFRSNFRIHNYHSFSKVYQGTGTFWSNSIQEGNEIMVEFLKPQDLNGLTVRSGNEMYPQDKLEHGTVEYRSEGSSEFEHWCDFKEGEAHCTFTSSVRVSALRVKATQAQTFWLIISHFECLLRDNPVPTIM